MPVPLQPIARVQADWQDHVDAVKRRFAERTATAPESVDVPDLTHIYVVEVPQEYTEEAAAELVKDPHVEYAHPDYIVTIDATPLPNVSFIPNDPYVTLDRIYWREGSWSQPYPDLWGLQKIQAIEAWNQFAAPATDPGRGVVVAVVDTGLDYTHADILGNVWVNPGEDINHNGVVDGTNSCPVPSGDFNCVDNDSNGYVDDLRGWNFVSNSSDPRGDHFHGTHVSGTLGARVNNNTGIAGVAPNATLMPVKALDKNGNGHCTDLGRAVTYMADRGARVNNNSWGGIGCPEIRNAVQYAYALGVVVVVSAGNSARNVMAEAPANRSEAVTVAAFDPNDQPTAFTNFGSKIDVAAPGGGPGNDESILSLQASGTSCIIVSPGYCRAAGTSMAAPHVAGVAALIRSRRLTWNVEQVRQGLRMSADDVGAAGWDTDSGFGRVNALRAVTLPDPPTATITNITHEQPVNGITSVTGQVGPSGMSLARWTLSYRPATQTAWTVIQQVSAPPPGTINTQWDVRSLAIGQYVLLLEVQNSAGQLARDERRVQRSVYQDISGSNLPAGSQDRSDAGRSVRAADINGDLDLDVFPCLNIGPPNPSSQQIWANDGTGHFTDESATRLPAARQFACADALFIDVDRDGDLDLFLVASSKPGTSIQLVRLWINDGSGRFTDQTSTLLPSVVGDTQLNGSAALADIDRDGDLDIVTTTSALVLVNDGTGHFSDQKATRMSWLNCTACAASFADVDRDGDLDFITGNAIGLNNGAGSFTQRTASFAPTGFPDLSVGDVNGGGAPDILAGAVLYLNDGAGNFPPTGQTLVSPTCNVNGALIDADGDIDLDVLLTTVSTLGGSCRERDFLLLNDGAAHFTDKSDLVGVMPFLNRRSAFADVTGEGYPELLLSGLNGSPPVVMKQPRWDEFPPACPGDCNGNGAVTVDELVRAVNILLGNQPITNCRRGDANGNGEITCAEINRGTNNALNGCPAGGGLSLSASLPVAESDATFAALSSTVTQQIGSASGARGSNITIPVSVTGGAGTVSATQLDVLYPTNVLSNPSCVKASRLANHSLSTALPSTPPAPSGKTRLRTLISDLSAASAFTDGQIFSCTFTIKTTAPTGTHSITGERQHVSDGPGNELPAAVTNGSVTVF